MAESEEIIEVVLTDKQEKFCYEYLWDFNKTQAAIRAGYSKNTARQIAYDNFTKLYIQTRIKQMQENMAETSGISRMMVLREHQKLAFSSIAHLHNTWIERKEFESLTKEQKDCIAEIDTKIKTEYEYSAESEKREPIRVEYVKIKLYDKQKALDSISKMLGFDAIIKTEIQVNIPTLPNITIE